MNLDGTINILDVILMVDWANSNNNYLGCSVLFLGNSSGCSFNL